MQLNDSKYYHPNTFAIITNEVFFGEEGDENGNAIAAIRAEFQKKLTLNEWSSSRRIE